MQWGKMGEILWEQMKLTEEKEEFGRNFLQKS